MEVVVKRKVRNKKTGKVESKDETVDMRDDKARDAISRGQAEPTKGTKEILDRQEAAIQKRLQAKRALAKGKHTAKAESKTKATPKAEES